MPISNRRFLAAMSTFAMLGAPAVALAQVGADTPAHTAGSASAAAPGQAATPTDAVGEKAAKPVPSCDTNMKEHCKSMGHKHKRHARGNHHRKDKVAAPAASE